MTKIKAVFLDVGWTLLYPRESIWECFAAVCAEAGAEVTAAEAERLVHTMVDASRQRVIGQVEAGVRFTDSDEEFLSLFYGMGRAIFAVAGIDNDEGNSLTNRFFDRFWKAENWAIFPDVFDGLEQLRARGLKLGVLSNAGSDLVAFLEALGLLKWFDFAVVSAVEGVKKPDTEIFVRALNRAGVDAREAVHVGDMFIEDIVGARRAGVRALLVDRGERSMFPNYPEAAGHAPGGLEVVRDLYDVVAVVSSD